MSGGCCNCESRFTQYDDLIKAMQIEIQGLKLSQSGNDNMIKVGGITFTSRDHLMLWARDNLPGIIPYGCFNDCFTFLNRMLDSVNAQGNVGLGSLLNQHKLNLNGDEAIALESFQVSLPKIFGAAGSISALKGASKSWIATMPTPDSWEDPQSSMGIRERLRSQMSNI